MGELNKTHFSLMLTLIITLDLMLTNDVNLKDRYEVVDAIVHFQRRQLTC